jgi:hypothetical protein
MGRARQIQADALSARAFDRVRRIGMTLPKVESSVKYDGSPRLTLGGAFLAGLALDAEPDTLVVRYDLEERDCLLDDAPETYYITDAHAKHPVVLARLSRLDDAALRDLLTVSWKLTRPKARAGATSLRARRVSRP